MEALTPTFSRLSLPLKYWAKNYRGDICKILTNSVMEIKATTDICYICIQTKEHSLEQAKNDDGIICEKKATWM